jgi:hypothetical protein
MAEKKTITINPDLFSMSGKGGTRKKKPKTDSNNSGIRIKTPSAKKREDTLKKRSILKMIRGHQEERYKQMFEKNHGSLSPSIEIRNTPDNFNKDFKEATLFLQNLTEKKEHENKIKNHTIKQYPNQTSSSLLYHPTLTPLEVVNADENVSLNFPKEAISISHSNPLMRNNTLVSNSLILPTPKYGVLKNGSLPTYRTYMNETRKNYASITPQSQHSNTNFIMSGGNSTQQQQQQQPIQVALPTQSEMIEKRIDDSIKRASEITQMSTAMQNVKMGSFPKKYRQKKTRRRTHKVGKSSAFNRVSVLVSNKTLRNNISTKVQLLKQIPIKDVKNYLIKRGFIKVGSTAPNDVLRKMYETATLICGEIQNHAPDNLLYNFMNYNEEI